MENMKFFAQLFDLIDGVDLTIKAERRAGKITLRVLPKTTDTIQPAVVTGTPEELDAGFFQAISLPINQNKGLIIELDEMHKSLQSAKRVTEAKVKIAETPVKEEKKVEPVKKSKPVAKKAITKKVTPKKLEPVGDMFG